MNGLCNGPFHGPFVYKSHSSEKALQIVEDSRVSMAKYQVGLHIYGCGRRYDSNRGRNRRGRCRFFTVVEPENIEAYCAVDRDLLGCQGCRKKTLVHRKTLERDAERELKAFINAQFVLMD
jgi:hypothetical protein